ncbi:hypothetical protein F5Y14DRAFT_391148 [Nemania sp. NC0429]|nr:hypothetical protein F5Y14DRAFT_391148 [Nemania sp. NC0429]
MADSIRGDGLIRAHDALLRLEQDPLRLDRERRRFSRSPPPCVSGTTTISASPSGLTEEQRRRCRTRPDTPNEAAYRREEVRIQLHQEREASMPRPQFSAQVEEERRRIWYTNPETKRRELTIVYMNFFREEAEEIVKNRWVEQGIWNDNWDQFASGRWKHEEPLKPEPEDDTDSEAAELPPSFWPFGPKPLPKVKQPKSDDEKRQIEERRAASKRQREASRPYHQFNYQVSIERERIQQDAEISEDVYAADINTMAYEKVKSTWTSRGIWNAKWGILPGMTWKHEDPPPPEAAYTPSPVPASPRANVNHQGKPLLYPNLFSTPPKLEHHSVFGASNTSQQGSPAEVDPVRVENNATEDTSSSHPAGLAKRVLRPRTRQAPQSSKDDTSHKGRQQAAVSLGPIHSSKVTKPTAKRGRPTRQMARLPMTSEGNVEPHPLASLDHASPSRSKRLRSDPARTAAPSRPKRVVRPKPEQGAASNVGIEKTKTRRGGSQKQRPRTTRENALG